MVQPAQPVLASTIYENCSSVSFESNDERRIGSGCRAVDDALRGGLSYGMGGLSCISGESDSAKKAVSWTSIKSIWLLASGTVLL